METNAPMTRPRPYLRPLPPLTPDLWMRVRDEFSSLVELPAAERTAALERLGRLEPPVAAHVEAMLHASEHASPLDSGMDAVLDDLIAGAADDLSQLAFGPYRLIRPLGRGGMGMVYMAKRDDLGTLAAIKILPNAWIDMSRRQQFVEEMRILAELSHESIAGLLDAGQLDDGTPWFAMQYVEGEPITDHVWRGRLAVNDILRLFDRLCAAVQHAHGHPVVHRDLKPSNVLVTSSGAVKLLDFGIAKRLEGLYGLDERSRTMTREVTMEYAAPEQLRGRSVGVRADVYALGIILYELLVGTRPYDVTDCTPADAEAAIRAAYPPSIARGLRVVPADGSYAGWGARAMSNDERRDIEALLARAIAPDVADRYGSVEAMRRDMQAFLDRRPLTARHAGWTYPARKFVRREWRPLSAAVLLSTGAIAGILIHNRELRASRDAAVAEAARTTRLREFLEDLFQGGQQPTEPLDSIRVATIVENGIRGVRALTTDPAIQVDLLGTLGTMSQRLGSFSRADSLFLLAIDRSTAVYGPDHPETLRARVRRAALLAQLGKTDSAERELRVADSLAHRDAPGDHPVLAEADAALGVLLRDRARLPESIHYLELAVAEEKSRDSTSREYASALRELGNSVGTAGDLPRADSLFSQALPLVRRLVGPRNPDVAFLLSDLGNTASLRGRLADAERYERESVSITRAWYGDDNYLTAAVSAVLAQTLIRLDRADEAIPIIRKTIDVFTRSPDIGPTSPNTGIAHSNLGNALSARGDHAGALREFQIAHEILRKIVGEKGKPSINVATNLAMELLALGHADSATALLRKEVTLAVANSGEQGPLAAQTRAKLGSALVQQRKYPEAIATLTAALVVLDGKVGPHSDSAIAARRSLLAAYVAVGDSTNAALVRAQLADTTRASPARQ